MRPPVPLKPLLLIAAAVLAVHLALLSSASVFAPLSPSPITRPFITRTLTLPPDALPHPPVTPAPAPAPLPLPAPRVVKAPAAPKPSAPVMSAAEPATATAVPSPFSPPSSPTPTETPRLAAIMLPGSLRLSYDVQGEMNRRSYSASSELLWQHDGQTYDARLSLTLAGPGSRTQTSRGQLTPAGLVPKRFGDKARSELAAHFERDPGAQGKVIFSANTPSVVIEPGAQDQLSIYIQLASLIAGEPERYPVGSSIELQVVGAREADSWRFVIESEEQLPLPGGVQATLKLKRAARQLYDPTVELWLAPALGYLPARIRLTQTNGNFVDQQLTSFGPP